MSERRRGKTDGSSAGQSHNIHRVNRRQLLKAAGGAGLLLAGFGSATTVTAVPELPQRVLGRTGQKVTILGLGTAPVGEGPIDIQEGTHIFGEVLDRGVNYVDTARIYGNAEEILGHLIPSRRDSLFIATKISERTADKAERSLSESFRALKTDMIDLVHMHNIGNKNMDQLLGKDGVLEYLLRQKEAGKIRFIGVTAHNRPANVVRAIKTDAIDVVMCVMNYADCNIYDFESKVLPEARKRNVGCVAMKAYVGIKGGFPNHRSGFLGCATEPERLPQALAYALDLQGVSVAVVGPYTVEQAIQNVELARRYAPLTTEQHKALLAHGKEMAPKLGARYGSVA